MIGDTGLSTCVHTCQLDNPTVRAHVEQILVLVLRPGDVVVLDNLAAHEQPEVRAAIEQAFAKLKAFFRVFRQLDSRDFVL